MTMPTIDPFRNALILTGPTASGKTALALELAERMNAEIIAMDSMTLYRGMDIGTAKPTREEQARIPHHLLDVLDPWESGNVAWWREQAVQVCADIQTRGKQPLFVGGTPFYLKALLHGLFESPPADPDIRKRYEDEATNTSPEALHARLVGIDPITAKRLHPNDTRRVVRALEVWELTGKPISSWQQQDWFGTEKKESPADKQYQVDGEETPRCLVVDLPRDELYARINARVEQMIAAGWIEEVRRLRELPKPWSKEAGQALGYSELAEYLAGRQPLQATIEQIQTRSRQFAKRQLTWFRGLDGCRFCQGKLTFHAWRKKMA